MSQARRLRPRPRCPALCRLACSANRSPRALPPRFPRGHCHWFPPPRAPWSTAGAGPSVSALFCPAARPPSSFYFRGNRACSACSPESSAQPPGGGVGQPGRAVSQMAKALAARLGFTGLAGLCVVLPANNFPWPPPCRRDDHRGRTAERSAASRRDAATLSQSAAKRQRGRSARFGDKRRAAPCLRGKSAARREPGVRFTLSSMGRRWLRPGFSERKSRCR